MSVSNRMTPNDFTKESRQKFIEEAKSIQDMDFLGVDSPIPGQSFVCLSFVSPEEFIEQRSLWNFNKFLQNLTKKREVPAELNDDMKIPETLFQELLRGNINYDSVKEAYESFLEFNNEKLSEEFDELTGGRTCVRGLKIRGTYPTYIEAKARSNQLAELDKSHHVYIGQVGYWLPWDPSPVEVPEQEYQDKELNLLMKKYEENRHNKDVHYEERKREKLKEAIERNKEKKESGDVTHTEKEELEKLRQIVKEKDELLAKNKSSEPQQQEPEQEKKKRGRPKKNKKPESKDVPLASSSNKNQKNPLPPPPVVTEEDRKKREEINTVFQGEDPWMARKRNQ